MTDFDLMRVAANDIANLEQRLALAERQRESAITVGNDAIKVATQLGDQLDAMKIRLSGAFPIDEILVRARRKVPFRDYRDLHSIGFNDGRQQLTAAISQAYDDWLASNPGNEDGKNG